VTPAAPSRSPAYRRDGAAWLIEIRLRRLAALARAPVTIAALES
jgi:hypothetical protein